MGIIALFVALFSFAFVWNTDHVILKWVILGGGVLAAYIRAIVSSIQRRIDQYDEKVLKFWMHAAVVSFWISIIISVIGLFNVD